MRRFLPDVWYPTTVVGNEESEEHVRVESCKVIGSTTSRP